MNMTHWKTNKQFTWVTTSIGPGLVFAWRIGSCTLLYHVGILVWRWRRRSCNPRFRTFNNQVTHLPTTVKRNQMPFIFYLLVVLINNSHRDNEFLQINLNSHSGRLPPSSHLSIVINLHYVS